MHEILFEKLKDLEFATKKLQENCTTMSNVRAIFDAVIEELPETADRLFGCALILHSVQSKFAVVKLHQGIRLRFRGKAFAMFLFSSFPEAREVTVPITFRLLRMR